MPTAIHTLIIIIIIQFVAGLLDGMEYYFKRENVYIY